MSDQAQHEMLNRIRIAIRDGAAEVIDQLDDQTLVAWLAFGLGVFGTVAAACAWCCRRRFLYPAVRLLTFELSFSFNVVILLRTAILADSRCGPSRPWTRRPG